MTVADETQSLRHETLWTFCARHLARQESPKKAWLKMDGSFSHFPIAADLFEGRDGSRSAPNTPCSLPMLEPYISMMTASAMAAAGRLGLFEALASGPLDMKALAGSLEAKVSGVERLADFLVATGHLKREGNRIANAPATLRWFTSYGEIDYSAGLVWTADAWTIMDDLSEAVRRGGPSQPLWDRMIERPELGDHFARYMRAFAKHLSPDLLAVKNLPAKPVRLLDLGGSHGAHSIAFCHRYPELSAVIVDLESALTHTQAHIDQQQLANRVEIRPGDIRVCEWGEGYDVVLYLSVAHNMSHEENQTMFRRLAGVVKPGGVLIIHDYPREMTPAIFEAAFRLTLLVETGTRTFTYAELTDMLGDAGFHDPQSIVLSPAEKGTLIVSRR